VITYSVFGPHAEQLESKLEVFSNGIFVQVLWQNFSFVYYLPGLFVLLLDHKGKVTLEPFRNVSFDGFHENKGPKSQGRSKLDWVFSFIILPL
jgi:hypothetical protein